MRNRFAVAKLAACIGLLVFCACGLDEYYTSVGDKAVPGQPLFEGGQNDQDIVVVCTCNCQGGGGDEGLVGQSWIMDKFALGKPLNLFQSAVNDFIRTEIGKGTINILMSVTDDQVDTGNAAEATDVSDSADVIDSAETADATGARVLTIDFGVGTKGASSYSFTDTPVTVTATMASDGTFKFNEGVERFVLSVPMEGNDPISIPIQKVILAGTISSNGASIADGTLTGVVSLEDAKNTYVLLGTLDVLLTDSEGAAMDYDLDGDGTMDGWVFEGTFTTKTCTIE